MVGRGPRVGWRGRGPGVDWGGRGPGVGWVEGTWGRMVGRGPGVGRGRSVQPAPPVRSISFSPLDWAPAMYGPVWTAVGQCPREAVMESKSQHPDLAPLQNRAHRGVYLRVRMSVLLEELTVRRAAPQARSPLPGLPPPLSPEMEALSNLGHPDLLRQNHRSPPSVLSPIRQPLQLPPPTRPPQQEALPSPVPPEPAPHPGPSRPRAMTPGQRAWEPCRLSEPSSASLLGFLSRPLSGLSVWPTWVCVPPRCHLQMEGEAAWTAGCSLPCCWSRWTLDR